ncbi:CPBP family intramembrane glutamic endopeptidase [Amycolatopsis magusensis]|uniref:CPBP family intramembrane glutamic endopeptidase n=1 Tax=Amycolatopsis magusensis TaxID=882444 RepID=UPI0024A8AA31|nr:CPBP family intramembrane glutamic endopeptidase [Amycolatopsis magusensis]MDI5976135.1 CPBP family intramembrane metalloprotease [Amycolatopsis magusensis]
MTIPTEPKTQLQRFRVPILLIGTAVLLIAARALDMLVSGVPVLRLLVGIGAAAGAIVAYRWLSQRVEDREVTELAATGQWSGLGRGVLIGAGTFLATMLLVSLFTDADFTSGSVWACLGVAGSMASVAVTEELLFRGVVHRVLEQRIGSIIAIAISSLLFGLTHLLNGNATLWGTLAIAVEGGALLAIAYTATRSLWLPMGLHFAWNFTESGVFGTAVSGAESESGLLRTVLSGPDVLTGGAFGPEASLFALLCCLVPAVWLLRRAKLVTR